MTPQERFLNRLRSELGYHEKASNKNLDDPKANAGYNNYTKYARDLDAKGLYNKKVNGYSYCAVGIHWCLYAEFGFENMLKMTGMPTGIYNSGQGCGDCLYYYRKIGQVVTDPQPGDQFFIYNSSFSAKEHTGIIEWIEKLPDDTILHTIEFNTTDGTEYTANGYTVARKTHKLSEKRLCKEFGRPKWEVVGGMSDNKLPWLVIDISSWQKGIDLAKAKAEGVKAVILRGGDGKTVIDSQFETFYKNAVKNDLPVGCFWFSRATTVADARAEADRMIAMCVGKNIQLPIYIDCECDAQRVLGKDRLTEIVLAFAGVVQKNGYIAGVYTTENWLNNYMHLNKLGGIEKWIAKWSANKPSIECGMWQFGGETNYLRSKYIAGMVVDQDYMYKNYIQEDNEMRYYKMKDIDNKYYKPTMEKLVSMGVASKGGSGEDTIIDLGEDAVRLLCVLDKLGKFDEIEQGADADTVIKEIANILLKDR